MYSDEYDFNFMLEQGLFRARYEPKTRPPKIPVKNLKRDLPVYVFLISLAILTVVSLALLDADW
jgi:hypothetical protein